MNFTKFHDFLLFSDPRPRPIWAVKPTQGLQNVVFSIGNGSSGELGGAQGSSGELRGAQGRSGALRGAQGSSGELRGAQRALLPFLTTCLTFWSHLRRPPAAFGALSGTFGELFWSPFRDILGALLESTWRHFGGPFDPFRSHFGSPFGVILMTFREPFSSPFGDFRGPLGALRASF